MWQDSQVLVAKKVTDCLSVFMEEPNHGLQSLESHENISFIFDAFLVVILVPDLLRLVKLVNFAVEVGTRQVFVLIWQ